MGRKGTGTVSVKKVKEIIRLRTLGFSQREIARSVNLGRSTVQDYLQQLDRAGIDYATARSLDEEQIMKLAGKRTKQAGGLFNLDYQYIQRELSRKSVTLALLWQEYIEQTPAGCCYSTYCALYGQWRKHQRLSMRMPHKAGEKVFLDYAGDHLYLTDPETSEVRPVELFVGVLGASNLTYAEAQSSQSLANWIGAQARMFSYFGGVPKAAVIDNLKSGVHKAWFYDPEINPTYAHFAEHFGFAVLPTRVKKPRDKAKVEGAVLIAERWIIAAVRKETFFTLEELNRRVRELLEIINNRIMRDYKLSRYELFAQTDKQALQLLPARPYEFGTWKFCRVNIDYHIEINRHRYSVPFHLVHEQVETRLTEKTIEIFHKGKHLFTHLRDDTPFGFSTVKEHMPPEHQFMTEWTPTRLLSWAAKIGAHVALLAQRILDSREHPEQGYRAVLGLLRLEKKFGAARLDAACERADHFGITTLRAIKNMLQTGQDRLPVPDSAPKQILIHPNIRGTKYYH